MSTKVAIIGVSFLLPGCGNDKNQLIKILCDGKDCVEEVPASRKLDSGLPPDTLLPACATLSDISYFDYAFFGIAQREAILMDPQLRISLQLICNAIYDAGYALADFRETNTAVFAAASRDTYQTLIPHEQLLFSPSMLPAAMAGRIAYTFDLRGQASVIDTACSSSLSAVYDAYHWVIRNESECAIVSGIRLFGSFSTDDYKKAELILSPSGRARAFDKMADGTGVGEGGVVLVLKSLDRAIADNDYIYAVLLGGASNQDGGRSNGFAAPSAKAQEQLLLAAWESAKIDPESIHYIEAHGTATKLGDMIELQALNDAFAQKSKQQNFCKIGSFKSNIGHLDSASGIAGLVKAIFSLKTQTYFPTVHFTTINPSIDMTHSAYSVSAQLMPWTSEMPRRAGVSSFGITGSNVHVILEEIQPKPRDACTQFPLLLPFSGKTPQAIKRYVERLAEYLSDNEVEWCDVAYVLGAGRDHFDCRNFCVIEDKKSAMTALHRLMNDDSKPSHLSASTIIPIFVLPHEGEISDHLVNSYCQTHGALKEKWRLLNQQIENIENTQQQRQASCFINKFLLIEIAYELGITPAILFGSGNGNLLVDLISGDIDIQEALSQLPHCLSTFNLPRLQQACTDLSKQGDLVFIVPWQGMLSQAVQEIAKLHHSPVIHLFNDVGLSTVLKKLGDLYRLGTDIDWKKTQTFSNPHARRIPLPGYSFEASRCWLEMPKSPVVYQTSHPASVMENLSIHEKLILIWKELLGGADIDDESDFFKLGGDSIMQTQLIHAIERDIGVTIDFNIVFIHPRLKDIAKYIQSLIETKLQQAALNAQPSAPTISRTEAVLSSSQKRMWFLQQMYPDSSVYNVTVTYQIKDNVNLSVLQQAMDKMVDRHAILRTTIAVLNDHPIQKIHPHANIRIDYLDVSDKPYALQPTLIHQANSIFNLANAPCARALLVKTNEMGEETHYFQFTIHHAMCDNWSINVLMSELIETYSALVQNKILSLPALTMQYADWAEWEYTLLSSEARQPLENYWLKELENTPTFLELPIDYPRPEAFTYEGAWFKVHIDESLFAQVKAFAIGQSVSPFVVLLSAFCVLLARYSGEEDYIIGVPSANRKSAKTEKIVGCFINTLPLRIKLYGQPHFAEMVSRIGLSLRNAQQHQEYPFDQLIDKLNIPRLACYSPLVQVLFSLQNSIQGNQNSSDGIRFLPVHLDIQRTWLDLSVALWDENEALQGIIAYSTSLFHEATIQHMWKNYLCILQKAICSPKIAIFDLPMI